MSADHFGNVIHRLDIRIQHVAVPAAEPQARNLFAACGGGSRAVPRGTARRV